MIVVQASNWINNKILVIYGSRSNAGEINIGDTLEAEKTFSSEDTINMLQKNNKHILAISSNFKSISSVLAASEGTIGKLLKDEEIYEHVLLTTTSLDKASAHIVLGMNTLHMFSKDLNKKRGLAHERVTDSSILSAIEVSVS
jgi:phospholipid/cholesterol/gamma-HCH transport system substrate-binding protein